MELHLPNDPGVQVRARLCLSILKDSVELLDALGFDAKVYYEGDKRLADFVGHDRGVNEEHAVAVAANLKNTTETILHAAGWQEHGKDN